MTRFCTSTQRLLHAATDLPRDCSALAARPLSGPLAWAKRRSSSSDLPPKCFSPSFLLPWSFLAISSSFLVASSYSRLEAFRACALICGCRRSAAAPLIIWHKCHAVSGLVGAPVAFGSDLVVHILGAFSMPSFPAFSPSLPKIKPDVKKSCQKVSTSGWFCYFCPKRRKGPSHKYVGPLPLAVRRAEAFLTGLVMIDPEGFFTLKHLHYIGLV